MSAYGTPSGLDAALVWAGEVAFLDKLDAEDAAWKAIWDGPRRWQILQGPAQLAIIAAPTGEAAIASLLAERGYGYLAPAVLRAVLCPSVQRMDVGGNPIRPEARP